MRLSFPIKHAASALLVLANGCSGNPDSSHSNDIDGGGPLIHPVVELQTYQGKLIALSVGSQFIEIIDPETGTARLLTSPTKGCTPFPITFAVGDATNDERPDLLVSDPACGNWIATADINGSFTPEPWEDYLDKLPAMPKLAYEDWNNDGFADLIAGNSTQLDFLLTQNSDTRTSLSLTIPPPHLGDTLTSHLWALTKTAGPLLQRGKKYSRVEFDDEGVPHLAAPSMFQATAEDWQLPFLGYDHLRYMEPTSTCDGLLLGVGFFDPLLYDLTPRTLELIRIGANSLRSSALHPLELQAHTFAAIQNGSSILIGLLATESNQTDFIALSADNCGATKRQPSRLNINNPELGKRTDLSSIRMTASSPNDSDVSFHLYDGSILHSFTLHLAHFSVVSTQAEIRKLQP